MHDRLRITRNAFALSLSKGPAQPEWRAQGFDKLSPNVDMRNPVPATPSTLPL